MTQSHTPPAVALPRPDSSRWLSPLLVGLSAIVLTCFLVTVIGHLRDGYQINFTAAVFMGLAEETRAGRIYPDLHGGEMYGGTRYMPLPHLIHAVTTTLAGGDLLLGGKVLSLVLTLVLWAQAFFLLRRMECSGPVALAMATLLLTCHSVFFAATSIRGDLLPVVFQLAALSVVSVEKPTHGRMALAGLLCTLAVLSKVTAGWAALAILIHFCWLDWRRASTFAAVWLGSLVGSLALLHVISNGAMLDNFLALSAAGVKSAGDVLKSPLRLILQMGKNGSGTHCLAPLLVLGCILGWRYRTWSLYHTSLLLAVPMLLVIFSDMGTCNNHLIDLVVLGVLVLGVTWGQTARKIESDSLLQPVMAATLIWALCSCWTSVLGHATRDVVKNLAQGTTDPRYPAKPVARHVGDNETILSDDAWVPLSRKQRPVVLDAYSLARCASADPNHARTLVDRIERREFDKVVLVERVVGRNTDFGDDGEDRYMGKAVGKAIRNNYRLMSKAEGYLIYVPVDEAEPRFTLQGNGQFPQE